MSINNNISAAITAAQLTEVTTAIENLKTSLAHVLNVNLTADDRRYMLKMGDKTLAFVGKALDYASQNPTLKPAFMDLPEAQKDFKLASDIYAITQQLNTLLRGLEDANMLAGGEAYEAALVFYSSVKAASRSNIGGATAIYDDLKQRFPTGKKNIALKTNGATT
jgi:hypothetical protein